MGGRGQVEEVNGNKRESVPDGESHSGGTLKKEETEEWMMMKLSDNNVKANISPWPLPLPW